MPMTSHKERLKCAISNAPGTSGAFTVATASSGFVGFVSGDNGKAFDPVFVEGLNWEVRTGCVYTHAGTTLSRGTLRASSTGAAINFTSAALVTDSLTAYTLSRLEEQLDRGFTDIRCGASNAQALGANTITKIAAALNTVIVNPYSWWDTTNKRFQPLRPGLYQISAGAQCTTSGGAGVISQGLLRLNGATYAAAGHAFPAMQDFQAAVNSPVLLNGSTDYLELQVYVSGAGVTTSVNAGDVFFRAYFVSPG